MASPMLRIKFKSFSVGYKALQDLALLYLSRHMGYHVPLAHQPPGILHPVPQAHQAHSPASGPSPLAPRILSPTMGFLRIFAYLPLRRSSA